MTEEEKIILMKENLRLKVRTEHIEEQYENIRKEYRDYRYNINHESRKQTKAELLRENEILQSRIDEAIKYTKIIREKYFRECVAGSNEDLSTIIEILEGDSNEQRRNNIRGRRN